MIDTFAVSRHLIAAHRAAEVDEAALARALDHFRPEKLAPGQVLMVEGRPATTLHVLVRGEVEVVLDHRRLTTLRAPVVLGELGLLAGLPRSATVRALCPGVQLVVDDVTLWPFLDGPSTAGAALRRLLLAAMADVLAQDNEQLMATLSAVHPVAAEPEPGDVPSEDFGFGADLLAQSKQVELVVDEAGKRRRYDRKK